MRRRMITTLSIAALLAVMLLATVRPAAALGGWISKVRSDCASVQSEVVLVWGQDDGGGYDRFMLQVIDDTTGQIVSKTTEQITQEQSPWYWQTHRVTYAAEKWHYRVSLWDIDSSGREVNLIDDMRHDCQTHASWRPIEIPAAKNDCQAWMSFYTPNVAPEDGVVTAVWSYGRSPQEETNQFLAVWPIEAGQGLDSSYFLAVPCNVYVKLFYQPNSTKQLYFMPSQFWPNEGYGTSYAAGEWTPRYYTYFPLDGVLRPPETVEEN